MDSSNGMSQGQEVNSQPGLTSSAQSTAQNASVGASDERTFKQTEVNDIVKRAKYGAVEDFKRLQTEQPQYANQKAVDSTLTSNRQTDNQSQMPHENDVRRMAAEEAQRLRDQWIRDEQSKTEASNAQRIVQNFWQKIAPGREKYSDFDKTVGDINFKAFPNVVGLLAEVVDNAHDVLYELGKDRIKMANLENLAYMSPQDAVIQAQRLSQSLKDNDAASKTRLPNEPLSQIRPSNTGTDNGVMSVRDYRSKYKV